MKTLIGVFLAVGVSLGLVACTPAPNLEKDVAARKVMAKQVKEAVEASMEKKKN